MHPPVATKRYRAIHCPCCSELLSRKAHQAERCLGTGLCVVVIGEGKQPRPRPTIKLHIEDPQLEILELPRD
jgi:hypothetical protein